jgi:hypothetical protein
VLPAIHPPKSTAHFRCRAARTNRDFLSAPCAVLISQGSPSMSVMRFSQRRVPSAANLACDAPDVTGGRLARFGCKRCIQVERESAVSKYIRMYIGIISRENLRKTCKKTMKHTVMPTDPETSPESMSRYECIGTSTTEWQFVNFVLPSHRHMSSASREEAISQHKRSLVCRVTHHDGGCQGGRLDPTFGDT